MRQFLSVEDRVAHLLAVMPYLQLVGRYRFTFDVLENHRSGGAIELRSNFGVRRRLTVEFRRCLNDDIDEHESVGSGDVCLDWDSRIDGTHESFDGLVVKPFSIITRADYVCVLRCSVKVSEILRVSRSRQRPSSVGSHGLPV